MGKNWFKITPENRVFAFIIIGKAFEEAFEISLGNLYP